MSLAKALASAILAGRISRVFIGDGLLCSSYAIALVRVRIFLQGIPFHSLSREAPTESLKRFPNRLPLTSVRSALLPAPTYSGYKLVYKDKIIVHRLFRSMQTTPSGRSLRQMAALRPPSFADNGCMKSYRAKYSPR